ncbi:DEAD/DEAH box helicase family protein [Sulfurimonas sp. SAG-AH-194-C21]|nr:type I restriction endonuclease subunit R [Sulfurimonas sp. SAG-AH-194-C21]MDF1883973.1 DEAD/DEAH box helicase family protein [Sulfurimonas sp. SAG-AH-194-C21]
MNESQTRAELIDPQLKEAGWGVTPESQILREEDVCRITDGRIMVGGVRTKPLIADYILVYKGVKLAVVEAKRRELDVSEGVAQAKLYAQKLSLRFTYSSNGHALYGIDLESGAEGLVENFPTPDELFAQTYEKEDKWRDTFASVPFESKSGSWQPRYYQEIAVQKTLNAIAQNKSRLLLTLATGTGKTAIAFQIAWKLFQTRWTLKRDTKRRPRILFLADRNILADQAFNSFGAFPEDAMIRIKPKEIKKSGRVPTNGSIFFTIFQSFVSGTNEEGEPEANFGQYPKDYFDFIIIDECHRGGANDEGNWRVILEYFSPAVQLGLTATPKRSDNVDTYKYFGDPLYIYSLKDGINDGFLTPFKVKRIKTTLDDYIFVGDDKLIDGEVEEGKLYTESDFNKSIEIRVREEKRVRIFMDDANVDEKTIIFCATQEHAAMVRDIVNQNKPKGKDTNYCVRVTANDGEIGEQFLREFQDNEKLIPTILTTSQKLSTGVDARNIRNIVLMRPVNQIIEFKQIVGRGTRLFEGKEFFTIYDFVDAYVRFSDPEWDGEPLEPEPITEKPKKPPKDNPPTRKERPKKIKITLADGKEREIQHMTATSFWGVDGQPISAQVFLENLFGELPKFFKDEKELREIWSRPLTRKVLLEKLSEEGFGIEELNTLKKLINAEKSDIFDVLEYVFDSESTPMSRQERVNAAKKSIFALLNPKQSEFIEFVLSKYIESGVEELSQNKLKTLLELKYQSLEDAKAILGEVKDISTLFIEFQKHLYMQKTA